MTEDDIYRAYESMSIDDLEHFDIPKLDLSKLKIPKVPKINVSDSLKTAKNQIDKTVDSAVGAVKSNKKKLDRQWKKHKWKDRKRDKNGKWIYDYGNGFPGENKDRRLGAAAKTKDIYKDPNVKSGTLNEYFPEFMNPDNPADIDDIQKSSNGAKFIAGLLNLPFKSGISNLVYGANLLTSVVKNKKAEDVKRNSKLDRKTGLHLKNSKTDKNDDLKSVNPSYSSPDNGGKLNCYACSVTYDMRRRGYEVTATEDRNGANLSTIVSMYKNADPITVVSDDSGPIPVKNNQYNNTGLTKAVNKQFKNEPDNSRGIAMFVWAGSGGGHAVAYEIENGKAYLYDAQSGEKLDVNDYAKSATSFTYFRTDNLEPNIKNVKKVVS